VAMKNAFASYSETSFSIIVACSTFVFISLCIYLYSCTTFKTYGLYLIINLFTIRFYSNKRTLTAVI